MVRVFRGITVSEMERRERLSPIAFSERGERTSSSKNEVGLKGKNSSLS